MENPLVVMSMSVMIAVLRQKSDVESYAHQIVSYSAGGN
jgi:hypothetical protein